MVSHYLEYEHQKRCKNVNKKERATGSLFFVFDNTARIIYYEQKIEQMGNLSIVLRNQNLFNIENQTQDEIVKILTLVALVWVCFFIVTIIKKFIDSKKRPYHEWWVRVYLGEIKKIKLNNSEIDGKLRKIRNYSSRQIKHEMHLFSIHVRKRSEKDTQKMFNKYFFEIIGESLVCIENSVNANRNLKVYFDTSTVDNYLEQISNTVRCYSPRVLRCHQSCYCECYESLKKNFVALMDSLEKSKLEFTKARVGELIGVFESCIYDFKHQH